MDEEDVVADVLTKLYFCGSDVPDVKRLCFLCLRKKEEVMGVETCMLQSRTMRRLVSSPTSGEDTDIELVVVDWTAF